VFPGLLLLCNLLFYRMTKIAKELSVGGMSQSYPACVWIISGGPGMPWMDGGRTMPVYTAHTARAYRAAAAHTAFTTTTRRGAPRAAARCGTCTRAYAAPLLLPARLACRAFTAHTGGAAFSRTRVRGACCAAIPSVRRAFSPYRRFRLFFFRR